MAMMVPSARFALAVHAAMGRSNGWRKTYLRPSLISRRIRGCSAGASTGGSDPRITDTNTTETT